MINKYPYTDFNEYNMDWIIKTVKDLTVEWAETKTEWSDMKTEFESLTNYINNYFSNLDVQDEINTKIDMMIQDGSLALILAPIINDYFGDDAPAIITAWLNANITQETGYVIDNSLTVASAAADAKAVGDALHGLTVGDDDVNLSAYAGQYVNSTTGAISSLATYTRLGVQNNARVKIPYGCKKIIFNNIIIATSGTAGWATYTTDQGTATAAFIRGGRTKEIVVESGDNYYSVCSYQDSQGVLIDHFDITYEFITGEIINDIVEIKNVNNIVTVNAVLSSGIYVSSVNGSYNSAANYNSMVRTSIPAGCKKILLPDIAFNFAGTSGWGVYTSTGGSATGTFIRGGQTGVIEVNPLTDKAFGFSTFKKTAATVIYIMDDLAEYLYDTKYDLYDKLIGFVGDSVTYGYDDLNGGTQLAHPWPEQVGALLGSPVQNEGINSASLMDGVTAGGTPTPCAWVTDYTSLSDSYDILGVMIGINDCYRGYTLGTFDDRTDTTFYGALHVFMQGMQAKYPVEDGKRFFMMIYPHYEGRASTWPLFVNAIREVADYYSVPVLDLSAECGFSPYNDPNNKYWALAGGIHSPHLTQLGADSLAPVVAEYVRRMF